MTVFCLLQPFWAWRLSADTSIGHRGLFEGVVCLKDWMSSTLWLRACVCSDSSAVFLAGRRIWARFSNPLCCCVSNWRIWEVVRALCFFLLPLVCLWGWSCLKESLQFWPSCFWAWSSWAVVSGEVCFLPSVQSETGRWVRFLEGFHFFHLSVLGLKRLRTFLHMSFPLWPCCLQYSACDLIILIRT